MRGGLRREDGRRGFQLEKPAVTRGLLLSRHNDCDMTTISQQHDSTTSPPHYDITTTISKTTHDDTADTPLSLPSYQHGEGAWVLSISTSTTSTT